MVAVIKAVRRMRLNFENRNARRVISTERVCLLGLAFVAMGMGGFYILPGMIDPDASGSRIVNAFYCSVITLTTIGFGDICPSNPDLFGRVFLTIFPLIGLGFFCGPILDLTASWKSQVPGGNLALVTFTLAIGISLLTTLEGLPMTEALHVCVVLGTTIGYGDITPTSDLGRVMIAIYAIMVLNVIGSVLDSSGDFLESLCTSPAPGSSSVPESDSAEEKKKDE